MNMEQGPRPVSEALSELISLRGIARFQGNSELNLIWKKVAGEKFADQTRVLGLKRGILQIGVTNAPSLSEMASFHKTNYLKIFRKDHPDLKIRDIRFLLRSSHPSK